MSLYKLSKAAAIDVQNIFEYSYLEFGLSQADSYLFKLENALKLLAINPLFGRQRNEIKKGLYSIPEAEYLIFYRILKNYIRIVRILHNKRDLKNFL